MQRPLLGLALALCAPTSFAEVTSGAIDPAFGSTGVATPGLPADSETCEDLLLQPDGRIVAIGANQSGPAVGTNFVARFEPDGSLDTSFGQGGYVFPDLPGLVAVRLYGVALQPDGRILIAGDGSAASIQRIQVQRLLADGSLDPSFGSAGSVVHTLPSGSATVRDVVLQDDGKILVVGSSLDGFTSADLDVLVTRLQPDGSLDPSFGVGGHAIVDAVQDREDVADSVLVQADGSLIVGGRGRVTDGGADFIPFDFLLLRLDPNGALDPSFGNGGTRLYELTPFHDTVFDLAQLPDGRIVAAGSAGRAPWRFAFGLLCTDANGEPDAGFGVGGRRLIDFPGTPSSFARRVAIDPSGRILVGGSSQFPDNPGFDIFSLARVDDTGTLDPSFGVAGRAHVDLPDHRPDRGLALALDGDTILMGGTSNDGSGHTDMTLVRIYAETRAREVYCSGAPNSAGAGARIASSGSTSLAANGLVLEVSGSLPSGQGLFFYGPNRIQTPFGDGLRCVGGTSFRLLPPVQADAQGRVTRTLDLGAPPAASGVGRIEAGSTWNFQLWYRDAPAAGAGFNLSDALAVPFCP